MFLARVTPLLILSCMLHAQPADQLQSFRIEYPLSIRGLDLSWFDTDLNDAVQMRAVELRQQIWYDAPAHQLGVSTFTVQPGSPDITPFHELQNSQLDHYRVNVDKVSVDARTITFTGTVAGGANALVTQVVEGNSYVLSADNYAGFAPEIRSVFLNIDNIPRLAAYSVPGALQFSDKPNHAPGVQVTPDFETIYPEVVLDASKTTDPDGDDLDFRWWVASGSASLRKADTPTANAQMSSGPRLYEFIVTVTDSRGAGTEARVRVNYLGR